MDNAAECPDGSFITNVNWWYVTPPAHGYVTDADVTCSDGTKMTLATGSNAWAHGGGDAQGNVPCSSGYGGFRGRQKACWGISNGAYHCLNSEKDNTMTSQSDGTDGDWVNCPADMPVLVGIWSQSQRACCGPDWCGIISFKIKCGNANELQDFSTPKTVASISKLSNKTELIF